MLDKILGTHSKMVGLGEIELVIKHFVHSPEEIVHQTCSCGEDAEHCSFWGEVLLDFQCERGLTIVRGYEIVLDRFKERYGEDCYLVDSSKYISALSVVDQIQVEKLVVVHLLKDVRAFTVSRLDRHHEKFRKGNALLPIKQFRSWYRLNMSLRSYLISKGIIFKGIGYEELCLDPIKVTEILCEFIGVEFELQMIELRNSTSHCLLGNRMRLQKSKDRIIYDSRWFSRTEWIIPSILFPKIMRFNRDYVFSHGIDKRFIR